MGKRITAFFLGLLLTLLWLELPAMAQGRKGHTGGLGETKIHFNTSSAKNLSKANGITPEIADAIVKARKKKPFKKPDDLLTVPGITKEVLKKINPQLGVEGDLYTVPRPGEKLEEEDDEPLSPSKC
jgi:competence ComEA-like helix-hairpin-helix protein